MNQVIFSAMYVKNLLNENKTDEAKEYLNKFFFKVDGSYIFLNRMENKVDTLDIDTLRKLIPRDLDNRKYFDKGRHTKGADKFSAIEYLTSCEFCDESNTKKVTVNMASSELIIKKVEKFNLLAG